MEIIEVMTLLEYLQQRHTEGTAKRYYADILNFLETISEEKAKAATYSEVMVYIGTLRGRYPNPATIKVHLYAIKTYYHWLNHIGQRTDHPCRDVQLKDGPSRDIQLQDLFKAEELELLLQRKERYTDVKLKNQVIVGLLIYQGLTRGDVVGLTLTDINLQDGTVYVKAGVTTNSRCLQLRPPQILLLYKYIHEVRIKLMKTETDALILTKSGTPEMGEGVSYLLETSQHLFPDRKLNTKTIRQSVIANLLKSGHDLRLVQVFAGHKYPGSTERYRQTGIEELKAGIQKYHPLNGTKSEVKSLNL